jgi:hypothetical protein
MNDCIILLKLENGLHYKVTRGAKWLTMYNDRGSKMTEGVK